MKLVANIQLNPTDEQVAELRATLERCNEACTWLSEQGFAAKQTRQYDMQKLFYRELRERFSLTAQVAIQCIKKVADAYKTGEPDTVRVFRKHAAQPYDDRIIRFMSEDRVSIWLLPGRAKIPFVMGEHQRRLIVHRKGEVDLMFVRGKWYLACVCDFDEPELLTPDGVLGIDMGIVNIATGSDGTQFSGAEVEAKRKKYAKRRAVLQRVGTRAAKKRLKAIGNKHSRYQKHENHCISKQIVSAAKRSQLSIQLEDLKHIRARCKAGKEQRKRLHNWSFGQLRNFIEYKAKMHGVAVLAVDPAYTSQECPECGHIDRRNRPKQALFSCVACGHSGNADAVAARNISRRGCNVTSPMFAHRIVLDAVESPRL